MYALINAVEMNEQHPTSFHLPTEQEMNSIKVGSYVKLCFDEEGSKERMWVVVDTIDETRTSFKGRLNNDPVELKSVKLDDTVYFKAENIYGVFDNTAIGVLHGNILYAKNSENQ